MIQSIERNNFAIRYRLSNCAVTVDNWILLKVLRGRYLSSSVRVKCYLKCHCYIGLIREHKSPSLCFERVWAHTNVTRLVEFSNKTVVGSYGRFKD
jgi:hypothetical protein